MYTYTRLHTTTPLTVLADSTPPKDVTDDVAWSNVVTPNLNAVRYHQNARKHQVFKTCHAQLNLHAHPSGWTLLAARIPNSMNLTLRNPSYVWKSFHPMPNAPLR